MKLEDKLLSLRKQQGLTQLELAEALHISRQAISKWETGEAEPSLENLKSLSQIYHISLDELLGEGNSQSQRLLRRTSLPSSRPRRSQRRKQTGGAVCSPATKASQRILPFVALGVVAALLLGLVAFLWWWNLPAQQFSYWHKTPSERPTQGACVLLLIPSP